MAALRAAPPEMGGTVATAMTLPPQTNRGGPCDVAAGDPPPRFQALVRVRSPWRRHHPTHAWRTYLAVYHSHPVSRAVWERCYGLRRPRVRQLAFCQLVPDDRAPHGAGAALNRTPDTVRAPGAGFGRGGRSAYGQWLPQRVVKGK